MVMVKMIAARIPNKIAISAGSNLKSSMRMALIGNTCFNIDSFVSVVKVMGMGDEASDGDGDGDGTGILIVMVIVMVVVMVMMVVMVMEMEMAVQAWSGRLLGPNRSRRVPP